MYVDVFGSLTTKENGGESGEEKIFLPCGAAAIGEKVNKKTPSTYDVTTTRVLLNLLGWVLTAGSLLVATRGGWLIVVGVILFVVGLVLIIKTGPGVIEEEKKKQ